MRISTGTPANNFDPMVGLYNYGFRDYNPQRGAWTTQDPIRAGANWYAYVNEDPANLVDPLGLSASAGSKADISAAGLGLTKVPHVAPSTPTFPGVQVVWNPAESKPPVAGSSVQSFEEWQNSEIERSSGEPSDTLPPQSEDFTLSIMPPLMPLARSPAESAAPAAGKGASKFTDVLNTIKGTGKAPDGFKGGSTFANDGRAGGQVLPKTDAAGNPVTYKEWDVNPFQKGVNRGTERIVTGSDGRAYYTTDHYTTFNPLD